MISTPHILSKILLAGLSASLCVQAQPWTYSGSGAWNPPSSALGYQNNPYSLLTLPIEASASESPAKITLTFYASSSSASEVNISGSFDIYRKAPEALHWDGIVGSVTLNGSTTTWEDSNVVVGERYEYGIASQGTSTFRNGNILAGIKAQPIGARGRFAVVVTSDIVAQLPEELAQYENDLRRDGWTIHRIVTTRATDYTGNGTGAKVDGVPSAPYPDEHILIRNQLIALHNQYPGELKNVVLIGKVAVARSGITTAGPDGHGNRAAWAADAYYADMDGTWTDTGSNTTRFTNLSNAVKEGTPNIPGDHKFDPTYLYELDSDIENTHLELGFGRIDFSKNVTAEYESTRNYFQKLHRYKTAHPDFQPGRRAIMRAGFGAVTHAYLGGIPGLVGMEEMDFLASSALPDAPGEDKDAAYTRDHEGPYLFYFKGSGSPGKSDLSRAVFWTGMQSHWGYWFENATSSNQHVMKKRIAEDNFSLSYTWAIANYSVDTSYLYHRLGMGGTIGDMMRVSVGYRYPSSSKITTYVQARNPLFMNHMGDPGLRIFMFPPPTQLQVLPNDGSPLLSWTAASAPAGEPQVTGYHVYRAQQANGPFTQLTTTPVTGTSYSDGPLADGTWHYQVKALRLETCGGGSFYNTSLAAQQSVNLGSAAELLTITSPTSLPAVDWKQPVNLLLQTSGGTPLFHWSITGGQLPDGLQLSTDGVIRGTPSTPGTASFTLSVSDPLGQSATQTCSLDVRGQDLQVVYADATGYVYGRSADSTPRGTEVSLKISGGTHLYESFLRFDLSGIDRNQGIGQVFLVLMPDGTTQSNNSLTLDATLVEDAGDSWDENEITYNTKPAIHSELPTITASGFARSGVPFLIDITPFVIETLNQDTSRQLSLRLSSEVSASWNKHVEVADRHATRLARPRLEIHTHRWQNIDTWRQNQFNQTENSGDAADEAAPAGDQLPNKVKFVMGLDPQTNYRDHPEAPVMGRLQESDQEVLTYTFPYNPNIQGAALMLEAKESLSEAQWEEIDPMDAANQVEVREDHPETGRNTLIIRDSKADLDQRFFRIRVSPTP